LLLRVVYLVGQPKRPALAVATEPGSAAPPKPWHKRVCAARVHSAAATLARKQPPLAASLDVTLHANIHVLRWAAWA
jgi:hypothetical protein